MEDVLRSRSARALPNERARASVIAGVVAVAIIPASLLLAAKSSMVDLTEASVAIPIAIVLGVAAVMLSRSARRHSQITLGRVGGTGLARLGKVLGMLGLYLATMCLVSLGFFGLLLLFD